MIRMVKWRGFVKLSLWALGCATLGGCSSGSSGGGTPSDAGVDVLLPADAALDGPNLDGTFDAGANIDANTDAPIALDAAVSCDEKSKACATQFGSLFTKSNGRADGTLVALVRPADTQCTLFNGTHVVLQLKMQGQVQRLVVSIEGVATATKSAPLIGPAYAEGWHENVTMEYAPDLGVHSTDFTTVSAEQATDFVCAHSTLGAPMSVYAYSDGSAPSSAHQIHSNDNYPDGAIVIDPTAPAPTYLLFRYLDQVF
jgi:hypothetical protein